MNTDKSQNSHKKWYDNTGLLIVFFFFLPPVGIYGIIKRKTSTLKKTLYIIPASISTIFVLILVLGTILSIKFRIDIDYYKSGLDNYSNQRYYLAISDFEKVKIDNENYEDAQLKIKEAKDLIKKEKNEEDLEEIESERQLQLENEKAIEKEKLLKSFQKSWADSIVKSWKGDFIIANKLELPYTIKFELSKNATQSFTSNVEQALPMYVSSYKKSLKDKFGSEYDNYETAITFLPNIETSKQNDSDEWTRPITLGTGLKIYSGNQYSKEYVGSLRCKFKDISDGNTYYVVLKNNGSETYIQEYKFKSYYWVKKKDSNSLHGVQLLKCY